MPDDRVVGGAASRKRQQEMIGERRRAKQQITIRLDSDTLSWFRAMAQEQGIPYQSLINLYLRDCAESGRKLEIRWS